ncbi:BMC domain-containing protein [Arachnia propionica]|uniref:BMC domain-containing protein n=1 Tax=Arachnia propionica TaxID=1750 RepID=A0A3P1T3L4_9ACTN|nr:BMC domain-containing protein [Arachnia propionica]MDO5084062.1 BMC domain-containing protein [Arachnia propionica]RRD03416.1 BMC domain-containing protein [Arachnia propionica]
MTEWTDKQRIIQEFVPGKQVTLAHVIANPDQGLYPKIGLPAGTRGAIGVLTLTPGEAAVIAADIATKAAGVELAFVDRFSGSLLITGQLADVESAVTGIVATMQEILSFTPAPLTRT